MSATEAKMAILALLSLLGLWVLFCWAYRQYRIDLFRQRLFAIRDALFDAAREGRISFEHPAYRILRSMINGYIRFGHRLSFSTVVGLTLSSKFRHEAEVWGERFEERWTEASRDLPGEVRKELREYRKLVEFQVAEHVVFTSAALTLTLFPAATVLTLKLLWDRLSYRMQRRLRSLGDQMDTVAYALGEQGPPQSAGSSA